MAPILRSTAYGYTVTRCSYGLRWTCSLTRVVNLLALMTWRLPPSMPRCNADRQVAMAFTQVFSYMIERGVSYGYGTGGKGLVLRLHVELSDPRTLYYHLCAPDEATDGDI